MSNDILFCKKNGIPFISGNEIVPKKTDATIVSDNPVVDVNSHSTAVEAASEKSFIVKLIKKSNFLSYMAFIHATKKRALNLLTANKINHVISGADVEVEVSCFIAAANKLNICTWVYPFSLSSQVETIGSVISYGHLKVNNPLSKLFLNLFYKKWIYTHEKEYYLRQEFYKIAPMELLSVSPSDPWIYIGGKSRYVFIESAFTADYYKKAGIDPSRFVEIGAAFLCSLMKATTEFKENRSGVLQRYNLVDNKKIILCAMPPIYTDPHEKYEDAKEYNTCGEMVSDWVSTVSSNKDYQVIVNLHPRSDFEKAKYIEQFGVKIINEDIANLIPLCDLFVANASATVRMALACGKPVLDYDMQNFCYPNYDNVALVTTVYNKNDFHKYFDDITRNNYFENRINKDVIAKNYFGKMTCSFDEEFIALLDKTA